MTGSKGTWKEFLKEEGVSEKRADPALHSWQVLAAFVATLHDTKAVRRFLRWEGEQQSDAEARAAALKNRVSHVVSMRTGRNAWDLVVLTERHPRFADCYTLPSYEKCWRRLQRRYDCVDRKGGGSVAPVLYALDCEMCETTDDTRALARLCVVNQLGDIVLEMLVKPMKRIVDYRTSITGLSAKDFEGLELRRADAQRAVAALLAAPGAVLVGHALHHDLHALRLDFQPVIDTSLLYTYSGLANCTPALADLCRAVLGRELRPPHAAHDCGADAATAMELVRHLLEGGFMVVDAPKTQVPWDELRRLSVHGIKPGTSEAHLRGMLPAGAPALEDLCYTGGRLGALQFAHPGDADAAFAMLQGDQGIDSAGRAQKTMHLADGSFVKVRKNAAHAGQAFGRDAKPNRAFRKRKAADAAGAAVEAGVG
ncbi:hypothetical protein WJX81_008267 [Elliptochloris bilobata]|uniref:Exonuclease domain-containing protein n=1 Tax=Elliptochloris bilobata TaxID=381761 RepID=A0AAW1SKN1_9CHLO